MSPKPAAKVNLPQPVRQKLQAATEKRVRARLGLAESDSLPKEIKDLITAQIAIVGTPRLESKVAADVQSSLSLLGTDGAIQRLRDNLASARAAMSTIAADQEVTEILKQRAELLAKKRAALETAGFTTDQAMQIVLADLATTQQS